MRLYRKGVAPVIVPAGWYWPKNPALKRFREAEVIKQYLYATYGHNIRVLCEPYSTSIPENLFFTRAMFPNIRRLTIVSGALFMERTKFLAFMTFGHRVRLRYVSCKDGLSDNRQQQRLLENARCILKDATPGKLDFMLLPPLSDGTLRSKWHQINEAHRSCPLH